MDYAASEESCKIKHLLHNDFMSVNVTQFRIQLFLNMHIGIFHGTVCIYFYKYMLACLCIGNEYKYIFTCTYFYRYVC